MSRNQESGKRARNERRIRLVYVQNITNQVVKHQQQQQQPQQPHEKQSLQIQIQIHPHPNNLNQQEEESLDAHHPVQDVPIQLLLRVRI